MHRIRFASALVTLVVSLAVGADARADDVLRVSGSLLGTPAASGTPTNVYPVTTGDSFQLTVELVAADGTTTDVTADAATTYMPSQPGAVSSSATGLVTVQGVGTPGLPVLIAITYLNKAVGLAFHVSP